MTTTTNTTEVQIGYTLLLAVEQCLPEETKFVAALQKRYERLYDTNGTFLREILYDQSDIYMRIARDGAEAVQLPIDPTINRTSTNITEF